MTSKAPVRDSFPALRVFVLGVEVTADVISCNVHQSDGTAPDTAEFVLNNLQDKYVVTEEDIHNLYDDIPLDGSAKDIGTLTKDYDSTAAYLATTAPSLLGLAPNLSAFGRSQDQFHDVSSDAHDTLSILREKVKQHLIDNSSGPKGLVFPAKIGERQVLAQPSPTSMAFGDNTTIAKIGAFSGEAARYHFQVGSSIFHSNDPVRIFWRDPFYPTDWYFAFTGFVSDDIDRIEPNGASTLTIRCESVLRILRYARITTNPGIFDIQSVLTNFDAEFLSYYRSIFSHLSLTEAIALMLFGSTATALNDKIGANSSDAFRQPVPPSSPAGNSRISAHPLPDGRLKVDVKVDRASSGTFNFNDSMIYIFGPQAAEDEVPDSAGIPHQPVSSLASYQAQIDCRVTLDDLYLLNDNAQSVNPQRDLLVASIRKPDGSIAIEDAIKVIGEHPQLYPVDGGRFVALLPGSLGDNVSRKIVDKDIIDSFASTTQFTNRLAQIYDLCHRIDFSFYATPRGDIVLEMPLHNFDPHDFGSAPVDLSETDLPRPIPFTPTQRGPYGPRYTFVRKSITSWERSFSDEHIRTMIRTPYAAVQGFPTLGNSDQLGQTPGVITAFPLIPQFGVRMEMLDPWGYLSSKAAAAYYGLIKLNQWNADARTLKVGVIPRMGLGPNRPMQFVIGSEVSNGIRRRAYLATSKTVANSIVWGLGGQCEMTLGLHYVRGWDGQLTPEGRLLYAPIGGYASQPFDYNLLFQASSSSSNPEDSGDDVTPKTNIKKQSNVKQVITESIDPRVRAIKNLANTIALRYGVSVTSDYRTQAQSLAIASAQPNTKEGNVIRTLAESGSDPHGQALAFDLSGGADTFFKLTNSSQPGATSTAFSQDLTDKDLQALGARVVLETNIAGGPSCHVQIPPGNASAVLAWDPKRNQP